MRFDKRNQVRRLIDISAKLFAGVEAPVWDCVVMDISSNGARIAVDAVDDIPDLFTLRLTTRGRTSHRCRVIWRAAHQMGVKFEPSTPTPARRRTMAFTEPDLR